LLRACAGIGIGLHADRAANGGRGKVFCAAYVETAAIVWYDIARTIGRGDGLALRGKMKGQELAYQFYLQYGAPMLEAQFGTLAERVAVGLVGHGSECFGYDDDTSLDHDFSGGFCMWLTQEDYALYGQALQNAYLHLPAEFEGVRLRATSMDRQAYRGVASIADFYRPYVGDELPPTGLERWLSIAPTYLAEATNGVVWRDDLGEFSRIRHALGHYPTDVRLKKLAAHLLFAAQSGQYNYARCIMHGEEGAAVLALHQFVEHILQAVYLAADRYAPYYKWIMRALDDFDLGRRVKGNVTALLTAPHTAATLGEDMAMVDDVCKQVADELRRLELSAAPNDYLEPHAYQVRRHIADDKLRAMHIMQGV